MIRGLHSLGMQTDANPGAKLGWVNDHLASVHDVIALGDFYSVPGRENPRLKAGHYIAVTGVSNGWSMYKVTDPASKAVTSMTAAQLAHLISSNPGGGFTIGAW